MEVLHIVTGASSGVGRALSLELASRDLTVLAVARREHELRQLQQAREGAIHVLSADLSEADGRARVADWVGERYQVATLTHSAAIARKGYLKDLSLDSYRELMAINLEAPLFLTQALLPRFRPGGRVLQLSSGAAHRSMEYNGLYSISKAALLMSYRAWNADFPNGEILVGSAMPGVVEGPMQDEARRGDYPGVEMYRQYKDSGMLIQPERVAEFLCWLLFECGDTDFISQDWNIFDDSHHPRWLKGPLNDT